MWTIMRSIARHVVVTLFSFMTVFPTRPTVRTRNLINMTSAASKNHSFKEDFKFAVNDYIGVAKYVSSKTGLVVTIADVPGPVVDGYLVLATEAHDDDGLPHTLEHLVFMGSEDYPFKGGGIVGRPDARNHIHRGWGGGRWSG